MKKIVIHILNFTGIVSFYSMLPVSAAGFLSCFSNFFFNLPGITQLQICCLDLLFLSKLLPERRMLCPITSTNTESGYKASGVICNP